MIMVEIKLEDDVYLHHLKDTEDILAELILTRPNDVRNAILILKNKLIDDGYGYEVIDKNEAELIHCFEDMDILSQIPNLTLKKYVYEEGECELSDELVAGYTYN